METPPSRSYVEVSCSNCNVLLTKRKDTLSKWKGRCKSCAQKHAKNNSAVKQNASNSAKKQMLKQWQNAEYRERMSKAHQGKFGDTSSNWRGGKSACVDCGVALVAYSAKRCSSCFHKFNVGANHSCWNPELTDEHRSVRDSKEYKRWRWLVYQRDWFTCQSCGYKGKKIVAHHIKPFLEYPDLRLEVNNGIALCKDCHTKLHTSGNPFDGTSWNIVANNGGTIA